MKQAAALLVMTLVARRATSWAHDVVCTAPIDNGEVSDEAMGRFAADIQSALDILKDPDRVKWFDDFGAPAPTGTP